MRAWGRQGGSARPQGFPAAADNYRMRQHSLRGIGIRFWIGLTLPATGIALVIWTVVQLIQYQLTRA